MKTRETVVAVVLLVAFYACVAYPSEGCLEQPAQVVAGSLYEAQQMRCVEQYAKRADIDRCRDRVKLAWTVDKLLDAGTEGGDR